MRFRLNILGEFRDDRGRAFQPIAHVGSAMHRRYEKLRGQSTSRSFAGLAIRAFAVHVLPWIVSAAIGWFVLSGAAEAFVSLLEQDSIWATVVQAVVACAMIGLAVWTIAVLRRRERWLVRRILKDMLCPACGYSLNGLGIPQQSKSRACPECGLSCGIELRECPECQYTLDYLPLETDGCTVCPECGAAWRLRSDAAK